MGTIVTPGTQSNGDPEGGTDEPVYKNRRTLGAVLTIRIRIESTRQQFSSPGVV
jgi:hypothetical protein